MLPPDKLLKKPTPKLGETLGHGGYKSAHRHPNDPTKVILRSNQGPGRHYDHKWLSEIKMLNDLDAWGFPVLQVHEIFIGDDDYTYMIVDKHNAGRGDDKVGAVWNAKTLEMYNRINENSVKSIRQIVRATNRSWVYEIGDFQWLWADDGRIIINDPHIYINRAENQQTWDMRYRGKELWYWQLRAFIERVYAIKSGLLPAPVRLDEAYCSDLFSNATVWWKNTGQALLTKQIEEQKAHEDLEARAMAVMGIPTINYRWVEIAA